MAGRVFAVSDVHCDYPENMAWLRGLSDTAYRSDALLVAGDLANTVSLVEEGLRLLQSKFAEVCFVPGNHDLWVESDDTDSVSRLRRLRALCESLGVRVDPFLFDGRVWLVPLTSWYETEFYDSRIFVRDLSASRLHGAMDFLRCRWPSSVLKGYELPKLNGGGERFSPSPADIELKAHLQAASDVNQFLLSLNSVVPTQALPVVSFSHFVPSLRLFNIEFLTFPELPYISGSNGLMDLVRARVALPAQIRSYGSGVHVFGHTHINKDIELDGVRFVNNPLKYPSERHQWEELGHQVAAAALWRAPQNPGFLPKQVWPAV